MSIIENKLLNKLLNQKSLAVLNKYNTTALDFKDQRKTFDFICNYFKEFGVMPVYTEVVAECEGFEYLDDVPDHLAYLCKKLKSDNAKRSSYELLQIQAGDNFAKMDGLEFVEWLAQESARIRDVASVDTHSGTNFATNGAERLDIYNEGKDRRTYLYIPTPYKTLTDALGGGFELGDYVLLQSYVNRGKSWVSSDIGITAWRSGNGVIHYSPELSKKQQLQRLDTLNGKFKNSKMRIGELDNEDQYKKYLREFNENNDVPYIVKTMGDMPTGLSLELIESDLQSNLNVRMVIIDGFNLMIHKGRDGNRNNMTNTSRKLRQLFAKYNVVGVVVHQVSTSAERENRTVDESGIRVVTPARIDQTSETSATVQDACTILNFDQWDGMGKILLAKCRTPNVNTEIDLHCDFDNGFIYEPSPIDFI